MKSNQNKVATIDTNVCAIAAKVFLDAGESMASTMRKNSMNFFVQYVGPCAVNLAFACELYLKALLAEKGNSITKTHALKDLFELLDQTTQDEIRNEYDTFPLTPPIFSIDECLTVHSNAFVDWRYYYEVNPSKTLTFDPPSLYDLAISLNHVYHKQEGTSGAA